MSVHLIPVDKLSAVTLQGVIEEFVSRNGTDYGAVEASRKTSSNQILHQLEKGLAVLLYDDEAETTNILLSNDPLLKKLKK